MHTETVEAILVSQWEYVSAYYLLLFQISTFLGFIMQGMCSQGQVGHTKRRPLYPEATISCNNSWRSGAWGRGGGQDRREMWAAILCPSHFSLPLLQISLCWRNTGKMDAPISSTVLYIWRNKCSMYCHSFLSCNTSMLLQQCCSKNIAAIHISLKGNFYSVLGDSFCQIFWCKIFQISVNTYIPINCTFSSVN